MQLPKTIKTKSAELKTFLTSKKFRPYYIALLVLLTLVSLYHMLYANRIIPGVTVAGINLGGNTYKQAQAKLLEKEQNAEKNLQFVYNDSTFDLTAEEISLVYNWDGAITRAFEVGRSGNFYIDTKDKLAGLVKRLYIPAYYDFEEAELNKFLANIRGTVDVPAVDAHFELDNDKLKIIAQASGLTANIEKAYIDAIKAFDTFNFGTTQIEVNPTQPQTTDANLAFVKEKAEKVIFAPLTITLGDKKWELHPTKKLEFLTYDEAKQDLGFDKAVFRTYLDSLAPEVNELPRGSVATTSDNKVIGFILNQAGLELNIEASADAVREAYFKQEPAVELKTKSVSGPINPAAYGIIALLGEGKSKFTGSAQGRINNLSLAAERTNGVLVPPGSVYSMNDSIGEVSGKTGYDTAYIIVGSRTVLGEGGGVCQTSTTLFRAVLNAGLPIVSRHPHAYRVGYYELESPPGIDASIFQPSLDFQFKNDTPNYILVESSVDLDQKQLTFKLYGTPDGRKVEMTEPVISSQSPPPAPSYQDDPTLAKGVTKQVDFAAWGANVSFTRTVTRDDKVLYNDVFKTNYQPWRAVYLVGTKE